MYSQDDELSQQILGRRQKPQGLFDRVKQNVTNPSGDNAYKAGMALFGGKTEEDGASRLANQMALMQFKQSLQDPEMEALKKESTRALIDARARGPFWASGPGQAYYDSKTDQARALGEQAQTETDIMNDVKNKLGSGGSGGITPGTTMQAGPYNIPLNPKLDTDQASAVSSAQTFGPQMDKIASMVRGGIFNSNRPGILGNIERTSRQFGVDSGIPMLTSADPQLQEVQGYLNSVRRYAFGEGGKNLTGTEKEIVYRLLDTTGKNDEQIISDHKKAMQTIESKASMALGGRNAAIAGVQQPIDLSSMSDDELKKIAGVSSVGG